MQHCDLVAEHAAHPRHGLRRQGDFGDEQDRAPPVVDDLAQHLEIHQGLRRPGDAVDQGGHVDRQSRDRGDDAALVVRQGGRRGGRQVGEGIPRSGHALVARQPLADEAVHGARRQLQPLAHVAQRRRSPQRLQRLVHGAAFGCAAEGAFALEQRRQGTRKHYHALDPLGGTGGAPHPPQRAGKHRAHR